MPGDKSNKARAFLFPGSLQRHHLPQGRSRSLLPPDSGDCPNGTHIAVTGVADEMKGMCKHEDNDDRVLVVVQKELENFQASVERFQASVISEIHASRAETLGNVENIRRLLETQDRKIEAQGSVSEASILANGEDIRRVLEEQESKIEAALSKLHVPEQVTTTEIDGTMLCDPEEDIERGNSKLLNRQTQEWADTREAIEELESAIHHKCYSLILQRNLEAKGKSFAHQVLDVFNIGDSLPTRRPTNWLAKAIEQPIFGIFQTVLILSNTVFLAYEADAEMKAALSVRNRWPPVNTKWYESVCNAFNYIFLAELIIRIAALRLWFFCEPHEWAWNCFDICVVTVSLLADVFADISLNIIRTLRFLRAVRVVRLIKVLRFFRELRKIMFAITGSLISLLWCFAFVNMTMGMFAIFLLQGLTHALGQMDPSTDEYAEAIRSTRQFYSSLSQTMLSLTAGFTGGTDWMDLLNSLKFSGGFYSVCFLLYMLFLIVGVTNVLTGIFVCTSEDFNDHCMVAQTAQMACDNFVKQLLSLFREWNIPDGGDISWTMLREALENESVLHFLSAYQMEPTHARLVFDLLDESSTGQVSVHDFILGLMRLKGESKAIDARIIQRQIGMLPKALITNRKEFLQAVAAHKGHV